MWRLLAFSILFTNLFACPCGSIIRGHRREFVIIIPGIVNHLNQRKLLYLNDDTTHSQYDTSVNIDLYLEN